MGLLSGNKVKKLGLIVGVGLGTLLGLKAARVLKDKASSEPPGKLGLPFLGETITYVKNPHQFFENRVSKYGPVFKTRILGSNIVCFTGPEAFTFFSSQASFDRQGANPNHVQKLFMHNALPLIDGSSHKEVRSAFLQAFRPESMEKYIPIIEETLLPFLERWERLSTFEWVPEFKKLSASLCSSLLFGTKKGIESDDLVRILDEFSAGLTALPINLPFTEFGKAMKNRGILLAFIDEAISRHSKEPKEGMLAEILKAKTPNGSPIPHEQLRAILIHALFAAYGNIFRVLTLMCMSLAQNQGIMERARDEIMSKFPSGSPALGDVMRLDYLNQATMEVRRHNRIFASTFFDWVTEPVEYAGYQIPDGWKATGGIFTTMQDESVFTKPRLFDPDRFGPSRAEDKKKENSYIPQGGGSMVGHRCPAEDFTNILMATVCVLLLRTYTWKLLPQNLNLTDEPSPLPKSGLLVEFTRRS